AGEDASPRAAAGAVLADPGGASPDDLQEPALGNDGDAEEAMRASRLGRAGRQLEGCAGGPGAGREADAGDPVVVGPDVRRVDAGTSRIAPGHEREMDLTIGDWPHFFLREQNQEGPLLARVELDLRSSDQGQRVDVFPDVAWTRWIAAARQRRRRQQGWKTT